MFCKIMPPLTNELKARLDPLQTTKFLRISTPTTIDAPIQNAPSRSLKGGLATLSRYLEKGNPRSLLNAQARRDCRVWISVTPTMWRIRRRDWSARARLTMRLWCSRREIMADRRIIALMKRDWSRCIWWSRDICDRYNFPLFNNETIVTGVNVTVGRKSILDGASTGSSPYPEYIQRKIGYEVSHT